MSRSQSIWSRYAAAILSIVVATLLRWLLSRMFGGVYPFAPIFLAIIFSAWYGGFGPALTASLLGLFVGFLMANSQTGNGRPIMGLALYFVTSLGIASFGGAMAAARGRIARQIEELTRKNDDLRQADHRKDEFLALLAHELRNPLAPIASALEILKFRNVDAAAAAEAREVAERQLRQLTRLVDDLLDVARIMRGKVELRKERVELAAVVARAVETVQPQIDVEHHHFAVSLPDRPVWLHADPLRLAQAISNLLSNAAKYTEQDGRIELTGALTLGEVILRVKDSGIGIAPDALPRLFEMFMQVAPGGHRSQRGLGVGLALVRNLVEMHGGTVEAHSAGLGQGSEFVIRLPATSSERPVISASPAAAGQEALAKRILVVDDNVDAANSLAMLLKLQGHQVNVAFGGAEALSAASANPPELVFLDLGMPGMDGYEVARRLRDDCHLSPKLVAVTGWGAEKDRSQTRAAGFAHHLTKPVDAAVLEAVLVSTPAPCGRPLLESLS
jgi:signal transduction histidine kinase/ActR/RegA family two-component response regulator